jgi:hypothetical protein
MDDGDHIRPTAAQVRDNIVGIPKRFVDTTAGALPWSTGFDVLFNGVRISNRRIDRERRVGGLPLRGQINPGEPLRLVVRDGILVITSDEEVH